MINNDISTIGRFMGVVQGIAGLLKESARSMLYNYIAVIDEILDREQTKEDKEGGR